MRATIVQAESGTVSVLAAVEDTAAGFGPDGEILNGDVGARNLGGAVQLDGATLSTVGGSTLPVVEANVGVGDTVTRDGGHTAPSGIEVESVGVAVTSEGVEGKVVDISVATVGLDHKHLVGVVGVDVAVLNIVDCNTGAERSHGTSTRPVAVHLLNQNVVCGTLDGDTLVLVGDLDIVNPDVCAPDIDTIQPTLVGTANDHVVQLTVCAGIKGQVEGRSFERLD